MRQSQSILLLEALKVGVKSRLSQIFHALHRQMMPNSIVD